MSNQAVKTWVKNWKAGKYRTAEENYQGNAGWYDWFCDKSALAGRLARMATTVCAIAESKRFNGASDYVWFKNNCPIGAPLYDDFRISDRKTGVNLYVVKFSIATEGHPCAVYTFTNGYEEPVAYGTTKQVIAWFMDPKGTRPSQESITKYDKE